MVYEKAMVHSDWYARDKTQFVSWIRLQSHALCDALAAYYLNPVRPMMLISEAEPVYLAFVKKIFCLYEWMRGNI